jgi:hypothetical protein
VDVKKSSKMKVLGIVLAMTMAAGSAEARNSSSSGAIGFVLLKALQRSALSDPTNPVVYNCYSSMSAKDLYNIRYYESTGRMQIFKRFDTDFSCAEVSIESLQEEFSCVVDDLALAIKDNRAAPGEESLDINLAMENSAEYFQQGAVASAKKAISGIGSFFAEPAYANGQRCPLKVHLAPIKK